MAFRPTIAIVANGEIADIGYYRNWDSKDLFIEALGLAVIYGDCRTVEEVRERAFGTQNIGYIIEPEVIDNTQDNLRWLEDCSEMPISVDLSRRAIYEGYSGCSDEFVSGKPEIYYIWLPRTVKEDFYWDILSKHKMSLDRIDMDTVEELFKNDAELRGHLSKKTAEMMRKHFGERMDGHYDETRVH